MSACVSMSLIAQNNQSSIRYWGLAFDTESRNGQAEFVSAAAAVTAVLRKDGRLFMQGNNSAPGVPGPCEVVPPPSGLHYVRVATGGGFTLGLLSDGSVVGWGIVDSLGNPPIVPGVPQGTRYVDMTVGANSALLRRSDGLLVAFGDNTYGQCSLPTLAPGVVPVQMSAGEYHVAVRLSDGSIAAWGDNQYGQCNVPTLPIGLSYVDMNAGARHTLAVRSDGAVLAWGDNRDNQCTVPALPVLKKYEMVAGGLKHSVALRSDGVFVAWGDNSYGQCTVPAIPTGATCKQIDCGHWDTVARLSTGPVLAWGWNFWFQGHVPDLPRDAAGVPQASYLQACLTNGGDYAVALLSNGSIVGWGEALPSLAPPVPNSKFVRIGAGHLYVVGLRTDGSLVAWGDNTWGQTIVPPLPPGTVYTDFRSTLSHTVALRSDGQAVHFGQNAYGVANIPALPIGLRYDGVWVGYNKTALRRSDGGIVLLGNPNDAMFNLPSIPPGVRYAQFALAEGSATALLSDGTVRQWGTRVPTNPSVGQGFWHAFPPLPFGVTYVEVNRIVTAGASMMARRSDGRVVVGGHWNPAAGIFGLERIPPPEPGTSYVAIDSLVRVGPTSTYVTFATGCAGSRSAARLVPADTPRIDATLEVNVFDLPIDMAFLALGWQRTVPVSLAGLGMPGCDSHVTVDDVAFVAGQAGVATFRLRIPNMPSLVGTHFHQQAFVLDPAAGNAASAVVSNAAEGVVGSY